MPTKKLVYENGRPKLVGLDYRSRKNSDQKYNRYRAEHNHDYIKFYHSSQWLHVREQVLLRDGYRCQRCGLEATLVDHIIPSSEDWESRLDTVNLQSLCKDCHYFKTRREDAKHKKGIRRSMKITVVAGYPASGKTTYVQEHKTDHDLIFDYDYLMSALSGKSLHTFDVNLHDYIELIYEMILRKLKAEQTFDNVWIIRSFTDKKLDSLLVNRDLHHIYIDTDKDTCRQRIVDQGRDLQDFEKVVKKIDKSIDSGDYHGYKKIS